MTKSLKPKEIVKEIKNNFTNFTIEDLRALNPNIPDYKYINEDKS